MILLCTRDGGESMVQKNSRINFAIKKKNRRSTWKEAVVSVMKNLASFCS